MNTENLVLKRSLMFQSFAPLFALLAIKYFNPAMFWHLTVSFVKLFSDKGMVAVPIAVANKNFGSFLIFAISLIWLLATFIVAIGFTGMQKSGFRSAGEKISIVGSPDTGNGIFLVNYILPLMINDVSSIRKLMSFLLLLSTVIVVLIDSDTFYPKRARMPPLL